MQKNIKLLISLLKDELIKWRVITSFKAEIKDLNPPYEAFNMGWTSDEPDTDFPWKATANRFAHEILSSVDKYYMNYVMEIPYSVKGYQPETWAPRDKKLNKEIVFHIPNVFHCNTIYGEEIVSHMLYRSVILTQKNHTLPDGRRAINVCGLWKIKEFE